MDAPDLPERTPREALWPEPRPWITPEMSREERDAVQARVAALSAFLRRSSSRVYLERS